MRPEEKNRHYLVQEKVDGLAVIQGQKVVKHSIKESIAETNKKVPRFKRHLVCTEVNKEDQKWWTVVRVVYYCQLVTFELNVGPDDEPEQ